MSDVVVTVPARLWTEWLAEGDLAQVNAPAPWQGVYEYSFSIGTRPKIEPGERVYIVSCGRLRGYSPLHDLRREGARWALVRRGGAVAVTIPHPMPGFRGWRYRWWERSEEVAFPGWRT